MRERERRGGRLKEFFLALSFYVSYLFRSCINGFELSCVVCEVALGEGGAEFEPESEKPRERLEEEGVTVSQRISERANRRARIIHEILKEST